MCPNYVWVKWIEYDRRKSSSHDVHLSSYADAAYSLQYDCTLRCSDKQVLHQSEICQNGGSWLDCIEAVFYLLKRPVAQNKSLFKLKPCEHLCSVEKKLSRMKFSALIAITYLWHILLHRFFLTAKLIKVISVVLCNIVEKARFLLCFHVFQTCTKNHKVTPKWQIFLSSVFEAPLENKR